ncbi:caspase family protein [Candidatus Hydrogenedentota bacterium]
MKPYRHWSAPLAGCLLIFLLTGCATRPKFLLVVSQPPGSEIFIDGRAAGKSPVTRRIDKNFQFGAHSVTAAQEGYRESSQTLKPAWWERKDVLTYDGNEPGALLRVVLLKKREYEPPAKESVGVHVDRPVAPPVISTPKETVMAQESGEKSVVVAEAKKAEETAREDKPIVVASAKQRPDESALVPVLLEIDEPRDYARTPFNTVDVMGHLQSDDSPIVETRVLVNGASSRNITVSLEPTKQNENQFSMQVALVSGKNEIEVFARNASGFETSERIVVFRESQGQELDPTNFKGKKWAILFGVSEYEHKGSLLTNLRYADADAQAFYDFLVSEEGGFDEPSVLLRLNEDATRENFHLAMTEFAANAIEEDLLIIFFAGHGAPEPGRPDNIYFMTHDTDPNAMASTGYPMWEIKTALDRHIQCCNVLFIADACHSAGAGNTRGPGNRAAMVSGLKGLGGSGRVIWTASEASEQSMESQRWGGGHGVFTFCLLEGLKGKADDPIDNSTANGDSIVTLGELMDYVDEQVRRETKAAQHPDTAGNFNRGWPMAKIDK